jgi:hypothetical protein
MATLEEIQLHQISLRPSVVLESPTALMSGHYLCGTARPNSLQIVHEVQIRDQHRELMSIRALINSGTTSFFISPLLPNTLGQPHEAAHYTTHSLDGQVIAHPRESGKTAMTVQYLDHLALVHEPEVLVVPMRAYNLVLGLPWFKTRKPEIDWANGRLTSLRTPCGQGEARRSGIIVQWFEGQDDQSTNVWLPDIGGSTPIINSTSEITVDPDGKLRESGEDSPTRDFEKLRATAFDNHFASDGTIETFALRIGECSGQLGATMEVTTLEHPGDIRTIYPKRWTSEQGAAAVVATEVRARILE